MSRWSGRRIWVVGAPGTGKTTLAAALSERSGLHHHELDGLYWLPGWRRADTERFRRTVARVAAGDSWIVDGQYEAAHPLLAERADTVIWLDVARTVAFCRVVKRTFERLVDRRELWNGNRQRLRGVPEMLLWAWRSYPRSSARNRMLPHLPGAGGATFIRVRSAAGLAAVHSGFDTTERNA